MMHQSGRGPALPQRLLQRRQWQLGAQRGSHRPAHRPPREDIEDHRRVDELAQQAHVGDVGRPQLIGGAERERGGQIRVHGEGVVGIGGAFPGALAGP